MGDLLTLSRAESGGLDLRHEEVDLRMVATDALEMLEEVVRLRELDVGLNLPDAPVLVLGDVHALDQVALNLLSNAIKFTPDGGRVRLSVSAAGKDACVAVSDTGMGIAEEDQRQLFTRFFRTSAAAERAIQGTGLGLSIVHAIVTQHGGSISVESALGSGTIVRVLLPRAFRPDR